MPKGQYKHKDRKIDPVKVKALAELGVPNSDIAKTQDVNPATIWRFLQRNEIDTPKISYYRKNRAEILSILQCDELELHNRIVKSYLDKDIETINTMPHQAKTNLLNALNNSFGIKYDKERLEDGLSTSIVAYADMVKAREILKAEQNGLKQAESSSSET